MSDHFVLHLCLLDWNCLYIDYCCVKTCTHIRRVEVQDDRLRGLDPMLMGLDKSHY